jgi:hypothetical protein
MNTVRLDGDISFINEEFYADAVSPVQLDHLLADGWRHFGIQFFRYSLGVYEFDIRRVIPLRIRLVDFSTSKSQRRVLRDNSDARVTLSPIEITDEAVALFDRHKLRFKSGVPDSVYDFLSDDPSSVPCDSRQVTVRVDGRLVAVSYLDVGARSVSAIYGMLSPTSRGGASGFSQCSKRLSSRSKAERNSITRATHTTVRRSMTTRSDSAAPRASTGRDTGVSSTQKQFDRGLGGSTGSRQV